MKLYPLLIFTTVLFYCCGCRNTYTSDSSSLRDELYALVDTVPGTVGIAFISDNDTATVNNGVKYPMMSVFKFHQALAVAENVEKRGTTLDSMLLIHTDELDRDTWSPMLKKYPEGDFNISISELLAYAITQSDNNASNYMFDNLLSVEATDSYTAALIPRESFRLAVTEAEMFEDHSLCYENRSSPLGAALLIDRLCSDIAICTRDRDFIIRAMRECRTGTDRIVAPLAGIEGVAVAHKTGSGFRDPATGILSAHNDVGFITLPDGRHYSLAVLVKDFKGSEAEAAKAIAEVSAAVYAYLTGK